MIFSALFTEDVTAFRVYQKILFVCVNSRLTEGGGQDGLINAPNAEVYGLGAARFVRKFFMNRS